MQEVGESRLIAPLQLHIFVIMDMMLCFIRHVNECASCEHIGNFIKLHFADRVFYITWMASGRILKTFHREKPWGHFICRALIQYYIGSGLHESQLLMTTAL